MISKTERKRLKKIIGKEYSEAVSKELAKSAAVNKHGNPHSNIQIIGVFNGRRNHAIIENAIYKAAETAIAERLINKSKRKKILKSA